MIRIRADARDSNEEGEILLIPAAEVPDTVIEVHPAG
jgi:hypothetical protein